VSVDTYLRSVISRMSDKVRERSGIVGDVIQNRIEANLLALVDTLSDDWNLKVWNLTGENMRPFPTQAETFEAAGVLLTLVRGGSPDYKPGDYVHAGLCVADFAVQQIMQTTDGQFNTANYATDEDALVALQSACDDRASAAALPAAINWKQLLQMAWSLLKPIIDDLLKAQPVA
jgi:hypothetical protein